MGNYYSGDETMSYFQAKNTINYKKFSRKVARLPLFTLWSLMKIRWFYLLSMYLFDYLSKCYRKMIWILCH